MKMPPLALAFAFLCPAVVRAEDTAAVMAALKDEASECRYMLALCSDLDRASERLSAAVKPVQEGRNTAYDNAMSSDALREVDQQSDRFIKALDILKAKHSKKPGCFAKSKCERMKRVKWN